MRPKTHHIFSQLKSEATLRVAATLRAAVPLSSHIKLNKDSSQQGLELEGKDHVFPIFSDILLVVPMIRQTLNG
jgi:hypothetical protein